MSEGHKLFTSSDGTQILFDTMSGRFYPLQSNAPSHRNVSQFYQKLPYDHKYYHEPMNITPKTANIHTTSSQQRKKENLMNSNSNHQQTKNKQTVTSSPHHIPLTEHVEEQNNTPVLTEQNEVPLYEYDKRNDEPCGNLDDQTDSNTNAYKRSLNDSDDSTIVKSNKSRKSEHNKKENLINSNTPSAPKSESTIKQNGYNIPLEHIQRAVTHNLPCFTINFENQDKLPSAVAASNALYEHFERQHVRFMNGFSVVRYIGNQLKVGVKNKEDYHKLCDSKIWPAELQEQRVSVTLPKFIPEHFTLVVRYVPQEFSVDQVAKEVKKSANTVDNFRAIIYPYKRGTNDFRFTVSDPDEYNGLLRLGHIGVGNKLCIITTYKPANKLTFCNKCWSLGHIRSECQYSGQKCKFCLQDYKDGHNEICSKQYQCAQCQQDHYSLDSKCKVIQEYRTNLNKAVKQATAEGIVKPPQVETKQSLPPQPHTLGLGMFPPLPGPTVHQPFRPSHWKTTTAATTTQVCNQTQHLDITNQQLFEKICSHMDEKLTQMNDKMSNLEHKVKSNEKMGFVIRQNLSNLIDLVKLVTIDILPPIVKSTFNANSKIKKTVDEITMQVNEQILSIQNNMENNMEIATNMKGREEEKDEDQVQVDQQVNLLS